MFARGKWDAPTRTPCVYQLYYRVIAPIGGGEGRGRQKSFVEPLRLWPDRAMRAECVTRALRWKKEPHARASTASWMTYSMVKKALDESIPWWFSCGWSIPWWFCCGWNISWLIFWAHSIACKICVPHDKLRPRLHEDDVKTKRKVCG